MQHHGLDWMEDGVCRWNRVCTRGLSFPQTKLASAVRGAFDAVRRSLLSPQRLHLSCRFPNNCLLSAFTFVWRIVFCGYDCTHNTQTCRVEQIENMQVKPDRDVSRAEPMCAPYLGQLDIRPIITTPKLFLFTIKQASSMTDLRRSNLWLVTFPPPYQWHLFYILLL